MRFRETEGKDHITNEETSRFRSGVQGFSLLELILAIVLLGVLTTPLLVFVARLPEWQHHISDQSRREAGRTVHDQELAAGVDPERAPMAAYASNPAAPRIDPPNVQRETRLARPEIATTQALTVRVDANTTAETRPGGAGWQLGAAAASDPITPPQPPLPPLYLTQPTVTPADGFIWQATDLVAPKESSSPWMGLISAATTPGRIVCLELATPERAAKGQTNTSLSINAWELANLVRGRSWTEYAGNETIGEKAELLPDGRRRWRTLQSGRTLVIEPSQIVTFSYMFTLGAPVLIHGAAVLTSGSSESIDYAGYRDIQAKRAAFQIGWPETTKTLFGNQWRDDLLAFNCTVANQPGPQSGRLEGFFTDENASVWADQTLIVAQATGPAGIFTERGSWTLLRARQELGPPELINTPSGDSTGYSLGIFRFAAPQVTADGPRIGRLSANNGTTVSSGSELDILIVP